MASSNQNQKFTLPHIPELYDPNYLDLLLPPASESSTKDVQDVPVVPINQMIDALESTAHHTRTENSAMAYDSTLSATLDAFNGLNSYTSGDDLGNLLKNSWKEDASLTLRLIWQQRSIHEGKSEKEGFYRAFGWLYKNHPRTAIANLSMLVSPSCPPGKAHPDQVCSHGYWKDLLNILALAVDDQLDDPSPAFFTRPKLPYTYPDRKNRKKAEAGVHERHNAQQQARAQEKRAQESETKQAKVLKKLNDPKYRALYVTVARLFAKKLAEDLRALDEINKLPPKDQRVKELLYKISLAGKWAPTPGASHDRHTNITSAIILLLHHSRASLPINFPRSVENFSSTSSSPTEIESALSILRSYFQRWVLTPLRAVAQVPEPLMAGNKWSSIKYNRVPSVCMKNNMERFFQHDQAGFEKYIVAVESGKKQISGATLLPHQLVHKAIELGDRMKNRRDLPESTSAKMKVQELKAGLAQTQMRVIEQQWNTLIARLRESGSIDNAIAICDVSGSMGYAHGGSTKAKHVPPILPALALSLVLAQIAKPPFDRGFITFSQDPHYVKLDKDLGLYDSLRKMETSEWGMNTDFEAVFLKLILPLAVKNNIPKEDMIKRLFVFSDMQFDVASGQGSGVWETNYDTVKKHFEEAGYEMPQIVYWDLAAHGTVEVQGDREGVAMMNGFSANMMKVFMGGEEEEGDWTKVAREEKDEEEDKFDPITVMKKAVMRKSFEGLVVLD
ncbi:hypothetical protein E1B28_012490 [Marasmius oreades]|uniref:Uncharacterized protein n=1 Tax=Marasmius oreades TaxID=181124 RepID=A0A9P7UNR4_9AGAR|nr:uncharacterized protein E1B28_012490 [Marasmius oreades]KAG7088503.1 hypothetical protein E1B28_012490 [Marasmius oreades]